jgi:hypothetical protein
VEAPRYRKWLKIISAQIEKKKLDLDVLRDKIVAPVEVGADGNGNESGSEKDEIEVLETLDKWI